MPYLNRVINGVIKTNVQNDYEGIGALMEYPELWNPHDWNSSNLTQTMGVAGPTRFRIYATGYSRANGNGPFAVIGVSGNAPPYEYSNAANSSPLYQTAFPLAGRAFRVFLRARCLPGMAGEIMRSGMSGAAGLPATLALATPGLLAVLAPCRRRPVTLRPCAAFGVFHVRFPSRRASPERYAAGAHSIFALARRYQRVAKSPNSF